MPKRLTTKEFIQKSMKVHGNRYGYELVDYKSAHAKVEIVCKIHGVFKQSPNNHSKGIGCSKCGFIVIANKNRKQTNQFIKQAKLVHGHRYIYNKVKYIDCNHKVTITCKIHGDFYQNPYNHLQGSGCSICSGNFMLTTDSFIEKAQKVHGHKYDYSLVDYIRNYKKVKIICKEHGLFEQVASSHLHGHGCSYCKNNIISKYSKNNPTGWSTTNWELKSKSSKSFDSFKVYIIKCWNESELFYKIGRTFVKTKLRFKSKNEMPYNYEILNEFIFDNAHECFNKENELKKINKINKYLPNIPFGGMYECFSEYPAVE